MAHKIVKKIYRVEIFASFDSCTEFWEYTALGNFHTTREGAEKDLEQYKGLKGYELEKELNGYIGNNLPEIKVYEIEND